MFLRPYFKEEKKMVFNVKNVNGMIYTISGCAMNDAVKPTRDIIFRKQSEHDLYFSVMYAKDREQVDAREFARHAEHHFCRHEHGFEFQRMSTPLTIEEFKWCIIEWLETTDEPENIIVEYVHEYVE